MISTANWLCVLIPFFTLFIIDALMAVSREEEGLWIRTALDFTGFMFLGLTWGIQRQTDAHQLPRSRNSWIETTYASVNCHCYDSKHCCVMSWLSGPCYDPVTFFVDVSLACSPSCTFLLTGADLGSSSPRCCTFCSR